MSSDAVAGDRDAVTRALLLCGAVAGPLYLAVGLAQALTREGFDLAKHPLSVLVNGPGGWVQTANFAVTGLLVIAAAIGLARVLGPKSRTLTWPLAGHGLAVFTATFFPADPVDGFPPGTPEGMPTSISTTGLLHFAAGGLGFLLLGVAGLFAAALLRRRGDRGLAALSLLSGLAVLVGFFGGIALPLGVAGIWAAVVVGYAWLTALSLRLRR
jgi:hypothetical membrane protein